MGDLYTGLLALLCCGGCLAELRDTREDRWGRATATAPRWMGLTLLYICAGPLLRLLLL